MPWALISYYFVNVIFFYSSVFEGVACLLGGLHALSRFIFLVNICYIAYGLDDNCKFLTKNFEIDLESDLLDLLLDNFVSFFRLNFFSLSCVEKLSHYSDLFIVFILINYYLSNSIPILNLHPKINQNRRHKQQNKS